MREGRRLACPQYRADGPRRTIRAQRASSAKIGIAPGDNQNCKATPRKTKEPYFLRVEFIAIRPRVQHVVDQSRDVGWTLSQCGQSVRSAHIGPRVGWMVEGDNDEPTVRQRLGGITVARETSAIAVRDYDQRQPVAGDSAVLGRRQRHRTKLHLADRL